MRNLHENLQRLTGEAVNYPVGVKVYLAFNELRKHRKERWGQINSL